MLANRGTDIVLLIRTSPAAAVAECRRLLCSRCLRCFLHHKPNSSRKWLQATAQNPWVPPPHRLLYPGLAGALD